MTETIGAIKLGGSDSEPFLGRDYGHQRDYSENVAGIVDEEIRKMIGNAHQEAYDVLVANRDILDRLVIALLEKETLLKDEIEVLFSDVRDVAPRPAWTGSATREPSDLPPVELSPANSAPAEVEKPARKRRAARAQKVESDEQG